MLHVGWSVLLGSGLTGSFSRIVRRMPASHPLITYGLTVIPQFPFDQTGTSVLLIPLETTHLIHLVYWLGTLWKTNAIHRSC